jgi:hypothetical protein
VVRSSTHPMPTLAAAHRKNASVQWGGTPRTATPLTTCRGTTGAFRCMPQDAASRSLRRVSGWTVGSSRASSASKQGEAYERGSGPLARLRCFCLRQPPIPAQFVQPRRFIVDPPDAGALGITRVVPTVVQRQLLEGFDDPPSRVRGSGRGRRGAWRQQFPRCSSSRPSPA